MKKLIFAFMIFCFFCMSPNLWAKFIYVDNGSPEAGSSWDGTNSHSYIGLPGVGAGYSTIQEAINACSAGDTIYMRGGTYREIDIDIPESKNGTSWSSGNYTKICSYPGEWAVINGTGLNTRSEYRYQHIIRHPTNYDTGSMTHATKYWLFERFEVTGGRCGFWLTGGPMKFRYLYVHDNGRDVSDDLVGGIFIFTATQNLIEYCYFKDNKIPRAPSGNNFNILFDGDYRDTTGNGEAFQPDACVHQNEIRYNYISGSPQGIRLKGDQRFGYNDRDPRSSNNILWQYKDYGDKIHHNILIDNSVSIRWGQDFSQIYNNISNTKIQPTGKSDGHPVLYNQLIYNNTVKGSDSQYVFRSAADVSSYNNYYDVGGTPVAHIHVWVYNNIQSGLTLSTGAYRSMADTANDNWNAADAIFERNLVHNSSSIKPYRIGNTSTGSGCSAEYYSAQEFYTCSEEWRRVSGIKNWDVDGSLFVGDSGADQYITSGSFVLSDSSTIGSGGGSNHPYLSGVTIPSYIGATNPDDHAWVYGVLGLANVTTLRNADTEDPAWIEGGGGSSPVEVPGNPGLFEGEKISP